MDELFDDDYWASVDARAKSVASQVANAQSLADQYPVVRPYCVEHRSTTCEH